MVKLIIFQYLKQRYKGLKISLLLLYGFTFVPLGYLFTIFMDEIWYYYSFTLLLGILSSWIFFGMLMEIKKDGKSMYHVLVEYQITGLIIIGIFIIGPLLFFDFSEFLNYIFLDKLFMENMGSYKGYSGPNIFISSIIFLISFNTYLMIDGIKNQIKLRIME